MPIRGPITDRMIEAHYRYRSPEYDDEDYDPDDPGGPEYDDEAGLGEVDDLKEHSDFAQDDLPENDLGDW